MLLISALLDSFLKEESRSPLLDLTCEYIWIMSVALGARCTSACLRSSSNRHLDLSYFQHAARTASAPLILPFHGRETYSSLQHTGPNPEVKTAKVVEPDREDKRERVVILGSGWSGTSLLLRIGTSSSASLLDAPAMLTQTAHMQVMFYHGSSIRRFTFRL